MIWMVPPPLSIITETCSPFLPSQDCWNLQPSTARYQRWICCYVITDYFYHFPLRVQCFLPRCCLLSLTRFMFVCLYIHSSGEVDQTNCCGDHRGPAAHWGRGRHRGDVRYVRRIKYHQSFFTPIGRNSKTNWLRLRRSPLIHQNSSDLLRSGRHKTSEGVLWYQALRL